MGDRAGLLKRARDGDENVRVTAETTIRSGAAASAGDGSRTAWGATGTTTISGSAASSEPNVPALLH
jgi:hypothetical protein